MSGALIIFLYTFIILTNCQLLSCIHQRLAVLKLIINKKIIRSELACDDDGLQIIPEPTARSAVPGVSPGRRLLIPLGYLHLGKCEHGGEHASISVRHRSSINREWTGVYQARDWLRKIFCIANIRNIRNTVILKCF